MIKWTKRLLVIACVLGGVTLSGAEEYPASVSFLIADYKYNERDGVKICEIQSLGISAISTGKKHRNLEGEKAFPKVAQTVSPYFKKMWMTKQALTDSQLRRKLKSRGWKLHSSMRKVHRDHYFHQVAQEEVQDLTDLTSYHGLFWGKKSQVQPIRDFKAKFPGILIVDEFIFPYEADKYKLTLPFSWDPELQKYKPSWKLYSKVYTMNLADTILNDLGCDTVVIKPRTEYQGDGVCIVERDDLDAVLKAIITKQGLPSEGKISYWAGDNSPNFIVEQFIESDGIAVKEKGYRRFAPTYRMIFSVVSHQQEIRVSPLGAYGKLPLLSLDQEGSAEEKHKSLSWGTPCPITIPARTKSEMERQLTDCIRLYYRQILKHASEQKL